MSSPYPVDRYNQPKAPGSAGTTDVAVERIEEGLDASASGNALVRAQFDAGLASTPVRTTGAEAGGGYNPQMVTVIDTSGCSYDAADGITNIKRGEPSAW